MIKFFASKEGRPMIGLGLSRRNCEKLLEGKPNFIDLKVMLMQVQDVPDPNEATVFIFGGETEETMKAELRRVADVGNKVSTHNEDN